MTSAAGLQPFDFRKPSGLPDQVEQRLLYWQRGLASLAPERWSQHMATSVAMEPVRHESMLMIEARRQLPEAAIGCRLVLGDQEMPTLFVLSRPLALALIGLVLGESLDALPADRLLTTIEQSLCELLCEELAVSVAESWPDQEPLVCRIGGFEDKPHRSRLFALGERVLLATFHVQGGFGSHEIQWIASQEPLESLLAQADVADVDSAAPSRELLHARACEIPVTVIVRLGTAELHVSDLARLQIGDVIILDQKIDEPLAATVAGQPKFRGWPGRVGSRQAFQIETL